MSLISITADWEFQLASNTIPADPSSVSVPGSGWTAATSPFGSAGPDLVSVEPASPWAFTDGLWIRRNISVDGTNGVLLKGEINSVGLVYLNGIFIGRINKSSSLGLRSFYLPIPESDVPSGIHQIAILCFSLDANSYMSIEADYTPALIPFQPQVPITENLLWKTDTQISKNGTEDRARLMDSPRTMMRFNFPATINKKNRFQNIIWRGMDQEWIIPLWNQMQLVTISSGSDTHTAVTDYVEFEENGLVLAWSSDNSWQLLSLDQVNSGSIVTVSETSEDFSVIMPARLGYLTRSPDRGFNGLEDAYLVEFIIEPLAEIESSPTQYGGEDIYSEEVLLESDYSSEEIKRDKDIFNSEFGLLSVITNWNTSKTMMPNRVICENLQENWELRTFLHRRSGRYRSFWQPTFENDLRIKNTATIGSTLLVENDFLDSIFEERKHIAIETSSGWLFREITSVSTLDATTLQFHLNISLGIAETSVKRVCWLNLNRLEADSIDIKYEGGGVSHSSFPVTRIG